MKKLSALSALLFFSFFVLAQKSNYVFFTEAGEPFTLMLNGVSYNAAPQSNVKAEGLNEGTYAVRITFADASLKPVLEELVLNEGVEVTFVIKKEKTGSIETGVKKFSKGFLSTKSDSEIAKEKQQVDAEAAKGKYTLEFLSRVKISEASSNTANNPPAPPPSTNLPEAGTYRGSGDPMKGLNVDKPKNMLVGNYYALIIGVDNYKGKWPPLKNAVSDAKAIEALLKSKYKFNTFHTLYNEQASRKAIISELEWLSKNAEEEDNVFIYYSGHGEFKKELNKGFWVPADALSNSTADYISNNDLQTYLVGIKSKHTLLVSDACFSGDILRGNTISVPFEDTEKYYRDVHGLISRQAMTSGGIEPVLDGGKNGHSVFAYYFLKTLNENDNKYFDAGQLYEKIKIPVVNNSEQTPKLSPVKDTGDEGGQFIFIKK
ncbi:MAG: caspase family protein [Bacteroidetes bacterium]|nr:caspase family protein [Bacteroidota bacterium]